MKKINEINILDAICTDLQESICDLFDILKNNKITWTKLTPSSKLQNNRPTPKTRPRKVGYPSHH